MTELRGASQLFENARADRGGVGVEALQDLRGPTFGCGDREKQVFGTDVSMAQPQRLANRQLHGLLRSARERRSHRRGGCGSATTEASAPVERSRTEGILDPPSDLVHVDPDRAECLGIGVGETRVMPGHQAC